MPYFRVTGDPNDLALLPEGMRDHGDLAALADRAEAIVLGSVTRREADPAGKAYALDAETDAARYVWLYGYDPDPANALGATADAVRRETAEVIRWLVARDARRPNLTSESSGDPQTAKDYRPDAEAQLPPGFGRWLAPVRIARVLWGL